MSTVSKKIGGAKNGGERVISTAKAQKWYPAEDVTKVKQTRVQKPQTLRKSLVPGTVLILLAGRFRGKRVVLLRALEDKSLLVTGPFKVNGVPLRRVNARYVIATSTRVNVDAVKADKFTVGYFANDNKTKKGAVTEEELFEEAKNKTVSEERIADQKTIDTALLSEIKKTPLLKRYLSTPFSLKDGDKPHELRW